MIYILHGQDEFGVAETVGVLRSRLAAEDPMAELNSTELDGRRLTVAELQAAADAMPFMGDRRLVLVRGLLGRCNPRGGDKSKSARHALRDALLAYLPGVPPTTRLVFSEGTLAKDNPVLRWASKAAPDLEGDSAIVMRVFEPPAARSLPGWIGKRAKERGGHFEGRAANALAEALIREGSVDLRLVDSEIEKLITWADGDAIDEDAVAHLITPIKLETVFRFGDALAEGNGPKAISLLHDHLDEGEHPLRLLAIITRQIRILHQARALLDAGSSKQAITSALPIPTWAVEKSLRQARRFSAQTLEGALRRLLEIEVGIKTGQVEPLLALDLFVAGMCGAGVER